MAVFLEAANFIVYLDDWYVKLEGYTCGWGGNCSGNQDWYYEGSRTRSATRDDVSLCRAACDKSTECGGFMVTDTLCYLRKNAECGVNVSPTRDCYQKTGKRHRFVVSIKLVYPFGSRIPNIKPNVRKRLSPL